MNYAMLVMIGGGLGSLFRYWMFLGVHGWLGRAFPYGTLSVNVIGSFLMGLLSVIIFERFHEHADFLRAFLLIGLLGGFTTFSAFSIETLGLFEKGEVIKACFNILLSVGLCLIAALSGAFIGRQASI